MKNYENNKDYKFEESWNSSYSTLPEKEIGESWEKFSKNLKSQKRRNYRRSFAKIGSVAAFLAMLFTAYFFLEIYNPTITVNNFSQVNKEVVLPDGSLAFLKAGSSIKYKEHFENSRDVELEGQAFFEVAKDSTKEFKVKTSYTTTLALGTSFLVTEKPGLKDTEVSLYSGRILVSVKNKAESWALIPGETFIYENGKICVKNDDQKGFKDFNNVELEKVFKFLEKRFNYHFITNAYTKDKRVTLRINKSDSLKQILKVLSIINHAAYEVNQKTKKIRLSSK